MIDFVQATKEDVLSIHPQLSQNDSLAYGRSVFEQGAVPLDGLAIAIRDGDRCIGAYGAIEMWPGVARVWALFSQELIREHPYVLGIHIRRDLGGAAGSQFHRIEATCDAGHRMGSKFLEWLGFTREALMRRYTPTGADMYLYARVCDVV